MFWSYPPSHLSLTPLRSTPNSCLSFFSFLSYRPTRVFGNHIFVGVELSPWMYLTYQELQTRAKLTVPPVEAINCSQLFSHEHAWTPSHCVLEWWLSWSSSVVQWDHWGYLQEHEWKVSLMSMGHWRAGSTSASSLLSHVLIHKTCTPRPSCVTDKQFSGESLLSATVLTALPWGGAVWIL